MDFFSFLPVIIFIYAIATIFNPGNKTPGNKRRQSPFPSPDTWKEKMEDMERQWFPKENPRTQQNPQPSKNTRTQPGWGGYSGTEGYGSEGSSGGEGTWGIEGIQGTEGTSGSEGTPGTEGTYGIEGSRISQGIPKRRGAPSPAVSPETRETQSTYTKKSSSFPVVTKDSLVQGVIWAEVLGKPRARKGWGVTRKQ